MKEGPQNILTDWVRRGKEREELRMMLRGVKWLFTRMWEGEPNSMFEHVNFERTIASMGRCWEAVGYVSHGFTM